MATTTTGALVLLEDRKFLNRLRIIGAFIAREVLAEANSVPFHNTRARWAINFLRNSTREVEKVALVVALEGPVDADSADAVLIAAVRANANIFAGAYNVATEPTDGVPLEVVVVEEDTNADGVAETRTKTFRNLFGLLR